MRFLAMLILFSLLGAMSAGCSDDGRHHQPITAKVVVSVPALHSPNYNPPRSGLAPLVGLRTVEMFPTPCYAIQYSKSESVRGRIHITIGDVVNTVRAGEGCADVIAPAGALVPVDSSSAHYLLTLALEESMDIYEIEIEPDRIRLIPIELHFTIPADSVWMR